MLRKTCNKRKRFGYSFLLLLSISTREFRFTQPDLAFCLRVQRKKGDFYFPLLRLSFDNRNLLHFFFFEK